MKFSIEKNEYTDFVIDVEVPSHEIDFETNKLIQDTAKKSKIDGFRPGKIPLSIIREQYGNKLRNTVIREIISCKYNNALANQNLFIVSSKINITQNKLDKSLKFSIICKTLPDINICNISKIKIIRPIVKIGVLEVDKMVNRIRKKFSYWKNSEHIIANIDDKVTVSITIYINNIKYCDINKFSFVIGNNEILPEVESNIINMKINERKNFCLKFSNNYQSKYLSGKKVYFNIYLHNIEVPELPQLNAKFFQKFGVNDKNAFFKGIKNNMYRELDLSITKYMKKQIISELNFYIDFDIPKFYVEYEAQRIRDRFKKYIDQSSKDFVKNNFLLLNNDLDFINSCSTADIMNQAKINVKIDLIFKYISYKQRFTVKQKEIDDILSRFNYIYDGLSSYTSSNNVSHLKSNSALLEKIQSTIIENKVISWILSRAQITETLKDFFVLVNK